jgi:hypothetical protein
MKLLYCRKCNDIFNLTIGKNKNCSCGNAGGRYIDEINAVYWGENVYPIGFVNESIKKAIICRPNRGQGCRFEAFIIPKCPTMMKVGRQQ